MICASDGQSGAPPLAFSLVVASKSKEDKGSDKHRRRKSKVTFAQLLDKYQNISEEKIANQPTDTKA